MADSTLKGGCLCGHIRYRASGLKRRYPGFTSMMGYPVITNSLREAEKIIEPRRG